MTGLRYRFKLIFPLLFGVVAVLAVGVVYERIHSASLQSSNNSFRDAPAFALKDANGKTHRLTDEKGNVVLIHFWASWCPPCRGEISEFASLAQDYKNRPLKLIAVSIDEKWGDALSLLPLRKPTQNLISLLDPDGKLPEEYGTYQYPETYLLNPKLQVVLKWVGAQNWNSPEVKAAIDNVLGTLSPGA